MIGTILMRRRERALHEFTRSRELVRSFEPFRNYPGIGAGVAAADSILRNDEAALRRADRALGIWARIRWGIRDTGGKVIASVHVRTDPACREHVPARKGSRRDRKSRGVSCPVCTTRTSRLTCGAVLPGDFLGPVTGLGVTDL